jgi:hypothetical protein
MNGTAITNRLQNPFKITYTDHRIIEILGLRPSNRLPVSYYNITYDNSSKQIQKSDREKSRSLSTRKHNIYVSFSLFINIENFLTKNNKNKPQNLDV